LFDDSERIEEEFNGQVLKVYSQKVRDEADDDEVFVNSIVHNYRYSASEIQKKDFLTYFKAYAKKLLDTLKEEGVSEEDIKAFQGESVKFAKFVCDNYE
jgi:hypothetical protein